MWINQKNVGSDEKQDSIQKLENRIRSSGLEYLLFITKSPEFSQSLLRVSAGADTIPKTKYQPIVIH